MTRLRRRIAERLVEAQRTAAILTTFNEIDMTEVMELRKEHQAEFEERHGIRLGFMSLFAKASVLALRDFPRINAFIEGEEIVYHDSRPPGDRGRNAARARRPGSEERRPDDLRARSSAPSRSWRRARATAI